MPCDVTILGAGPAGMAAGYFARKNGLSVEILEASSQPGGNAVTFEHNGFRFDSGAHRFHDKDEECTTEVKQLLGEKLRRINVPSQILHEGRWIDFPLSPLNLFTALGPARFVRAACSLLASRYAAMPDDGSFESFAIRTYGRELANRFLLSYSEKLWGLPCQKLSPSISGKRLKGLTFRTLLREAIRGKKGKTTHLDGDFYYPCGGFGVLTAQLAHACGRDRIRTKARVTKVLHVQNRIVAVEVNRKERIPVRNVVSTLPMPLLLRMLHPLPPRRLADLAGRLKFRQVILVALFLDRPSVSCNGSIYFPDPDFPMTRVYEPRNRCPSMSPPGKTSLVAEIPCHTGDSIWKSTENQLVEGIQGHLTRAGLIQARDVLDATTKVLPNAYPVLELGVERVVHEMASELRQFNNLHFTGRNGLFEYSHVHDMLRFGKQTVQDILATDEFSSETKTRRIAA